jgi:integrase
MTKIKVALDKRASNTTKDKKYPLVLVISHKAKTRYILFNLNLKENQYNADTSKITGIENSVRQTKRVRKIYSDVDFWVEDHYGEIRNWDVAKLKSEIEQRFFKKTLSRTFLTFAGKYLTNLRMEKRYSTASSYEDALKALVKYQRLLKRENDKQNIKTLYKIKNNACTLLEEFKPYDIEIKSLDYAFFREFKAYMSHRYKSKNTTAIYLRSLQAILNDARKVFPDLKDHDPLASIKKQSVENAPAPLSLDDIHAIRKLDLPKGSPIWHNRNYMLMMFNNMGMNFFDLAIIKKFQFTDNRIKYFRKKTHYEGDYFSVLQSEEALTIINYYLKRPIENDHYLFPIIPVDTAPERLHKVNNAKVKIFNKYANKIATLAGIDKKITSYTMRDTWTNIGLDLGVDIRNISSGLGHSSVQVTEKHYGKEVSAKILDEINAKITKTPSKN